MFVFILFNTFIRLSQGSKKKPLNYPHGPFRDPPRTKKLAATTNIINSINYKKESPP